MGTVLKFSISFTVLVMFVPFMGFILYYILEQVKARWRKRKFPLLVHGIPHWSDHGCYMPYMLNIFVINEKQKKNKKQY